MLKTVTSMLIICCSANVALAYPVKLGPYRTTDSSELSGEMCVEVLGAVTIGGVTLRQNESPPLDCGLCQEEITKANAGEIRNSDQNGKVTYLHRDVSCKAVN